MRPLSFPRFSVSSVLGNELVGEVTSTTFGNETWVADGHLGCLKSGEQFVFGRWHLKDQSWAFQTDDGAEHKQDQWEIIGLYWGEIAELVLNRNKKWSLLRYPSDDHITARFARRRLGTMEVPKAIRQSMTNGFV
jgi:hypothetical protein